MEMRKTEFDDYEKNHEVKKRVQISMEKREKEQAAKSSGIRVEDQKEKSKYNLASVRNSRFRQKLKQVADQMETPRDSVASDIVPEQYEKQLQKLEDDIRRHIRIEQQLKLHAEQIQQ